VDAQVLRRHVGGQAGVLGHVADAGPDLRAVALAVQAQHLHRAAIGLQQAERQLHQGRLAGAVGAQQPGRRRVMSTVTPSSARTSPYVLTSSEQASAVEVTARP
jgi:hypothetical protein